MLHSKIIVMVFNINLPVIVAIYCGNALAPLAVLSEPENMFGSSVYKIKIKILETFIHDLIEKKIFILLTRL